MKKTFVSSAIERVALEDLFSLEVEGKPYLLTGTLAWLTSERDKAIAQGKTVGKITKLVKA